MGWSEDRLHRWLNARARPKALAGALGNDAAVLRGLAGRPVACVDQTLEGVHFAPGTPAPQAGRKAAARALSDLAASAATPVGLLLALHAPADALEEWLREGILAVERTGVRHGAELLGGDLCAASGPLALVVTALGVLPGRRRPPGRDRARPGQRVVVTGAVGGSGLGRHLRFAPRLSEGRWLYELGATALMDVSDGLAWDLFRLARSSGVAIDLERIPVHPDAERLARGSGHPAEWHALHDGEDHELLATLPAAALQRARAKAPEHCPGLAEIGAVRRGSGLWLVADGARRAWSPDEGGWRHGS